MLHLSTCASDRQMNDPTDKSFLYRHSLADNGLLREVKREEERLRRTLRATYGVDQVGEELRKLQHGRADEIAHMMGVSVASLAQIADSNLLRSLADQQFTAQLFRRQDADLLAFQEANRWRDRQYRLPELQEASRLLAEYERSPVTQWLQTYEVIGNDLAAALESIRTPFLDIADTLSSVSAVAEIQSIGQAIKAAAAFQPDFVESLRTGLGDWRDPIPWPSLSLERATDRLDFYIERGLDRQLTSMPAAAFQEVLGQSGLLTPVPVADAQYEGGIVIVEYDDDVDPQRNANAYEQLLRFERHLRAFLDRVMRAAFGDDWPRLRVPRDVFDSWTQRREKAIKAGESPRPLIAYADFSDYEKIISRKDNWREIFAAFFIRPESIRESMQRLYPVRHCTMHARPVTQEDELLMQVEIHRVIRATRN